MRRDETWPRTAHSIQRSTTPSVDRFSVQKREGREVCWVFDDYASCGNQRRLQHPWQNKNSNLLRKVLSLHSTQMSASTTPSGSAAGRLRDLFVGASNSSINSGRRTPAKPANQLVEHIRPPLDSSGSTAPSPNTKKSPPPLETTATSLDTRTDETPSSQAFETPNDKKIDDDSVTPIFLRKQQANNALESIAEDSAGHGQQPAKHVFATDFCKAEAISSDKQNGGRKITANDFIFLKVLGKGSYGTVMLVRCLIDRKVYAMKMLRKDNIVRRHQVQHTRTERAVLESISHPFIVELNYAFQTPKKLYFVMEYCPGGELFFHLSRVNRFSEGRARFYAAEIVLALEFLHKLDIVYRDLKPENVLLDAEGHVRLTDFGLSKGGIADNFSTKSLCGTPEYLAPEILNQQGHGKAVDWWSLGALIYEMLTGLPPFYSKDRERLFENIRIGDLKFPSCISPTAKDLLVRLFHRNPDRRLGGGRRDAAEVKEHLFFATVNWDDVLNKRLTPPFRPQLKGVTDVQYFDREFVRLPAVNSEAPDDVMVGPANNNTTNQDGRDDLFPGFTYDLRDKSNAFG